MEIILACRKSILAVNRLNLFEKSRGLLRRTHGG